MNYRDAPPTRFYMCPGCSSPEQGPPHGGPAACSRCQTQSLLSDRGALLADPGQLRPPNNDPQWLAQLRLQDGRPLHMPPTLQAVLGGDGVQPGREQEALAIWQSLRARAAAGDAVASEEMTVLALLITQVPALQDQKLQVAIAESSFDAGVLPRHKQQHLGRLARLAVAAGDRARAGRYLSWMMPNASELETDSEFRVSAAVVATMDHDPQRVLAMLGPQKDAIPIADTMDPMASVFRANAYEAMGNPTAARQVLNELPAPLILDLVRSRFPGLQLCAQSGSAYQTVLTQRAAQRAATGAGMMGMLLGGILGLTGLILVAVGLGTTLGMKNGFMEGGGVVTLPLGSVMLAIGIVSIQRARAKAKRAAWLRTHGMSLGARIVNARRTGTQINDVPVYEFVLEVAGPQGPYQASFRKLAPEHEVAMAMGREVRVRADPKKLDEVILEE